MEKVLILTDRERELLRHCLHMRCNWMETGSVVLSRNDAIASRQPRRIRSLSAEQEAVIAEMRGLAAKLEVT